VPAQIEKSDWTRRANFSFTSADGAKCVDHHGRGREEVRISNRQGLSAPRVPGNPAAGHLNGTSQDIENYFNKCVATEESVS